MCVCVCVVHCLLPLSEVRELESKLDELRSRTEIKSLEEGNKENTEAIQGKINSFNSELNLITVKSMKLLSHIPMISCTDLEAAYKERQAACENATEELSKSKHELLLVCARGGGGGGGVDKIEGPDSNPPINNTSLPPPTHTHCLLHRDL